MGYYVRIIKSTAFVPAENLDRVYDIMCSLNETHDHEKHGGSWSGTKRTGKWFHGWTKTIQKPAKMRKQFLTS